MSANPVTTLAEICESVRYGYTASASPEACGPKFLRITDIVPDSLDWESVPYCEIDEAGMDRFSLRVGDIVVARTGATVGYAKLIREQPDAVFASYLVRFRVDARKAEPGFIGRLVESQVYKDFVRSRVGGAAQPNASAPVLGSFEFFLPPRSVQLRTVTVLSAYDDLIENNRRRIQLLEQAARLLYEEWFVRLRFPGHEHVKVVDGVPEGWERRALGDVADINRATLGNSHDGEIEYIDISSVSTGSIDETTRYPFRDAPGRARRIVQHGDIIWSCVRPNRRSYALIWQPALDLIASTGFAVITPRKVPSALLYHVVTTPEFVGYLSNNARGAAYPAVTGKDFEAAPLVTPRPELARQFDDVVSPIFAQIHVLKQQSAKLRDARDLLLPRLMAGETPV